MSTEIKESDYDIRGLSGIRNIGNTCYMNAVLQCLVSSPLFSTYIRENDNPDKQMLHELSMLFTAMWKRNSILIPTRFKMLCGEKNKVFKGFTQNDSQEMLSFILDALHEEVKTQVKVSFKKLPQAVIELMQQCDRVRYELETSSYERQIELKKQFNEYCLDHQNDVLEYRAYEYWMNYIQKSYSIVTLLYTGMYYSTVDCHECNTISSTFEPFTVMSVSIPERVLGKLSIYDCLQTFSAGEQLTGVNQYQCECCKKTTDATKRLYVWEAPHHLIIQIKRFKHTGGFPIKLSQLIDFPINGLDMKSTYSDVHQRSGVYDLTAVTSHIGTSHGGHYTAFRKHPVNNKWYEFNDESVYYIPKEDEEKTIVTASAYLLFYTRRI